MPTSLWWNHLSDHPLVQRGIITRGASHEASLPKGVIKKKKNQLHEAKTCAKTHAKINGKARAQTFVERKRAHFFAALNFDKAMELW